MAKTLEDVKKSREFRKSVIAKYGNVPTTVWEVPPFDNTGVIEYDSRKQAEVSIEKHKDMGYDHSDSELKKAFNMSSRSVRGTSDESGLSTFPPELARRIVKFWSEKGDMVLDPFAGHNSRMQVTFQLDRNYIGYDISKDFMQFNRDVASTINGEVIGKQSVLFGNNCTIALREQSSEKLVEADNSIDFVYTSPPYYKVEYYTDEKEQMYFSKDYNEFLSRMKVVIAECYRVLKSGKFIVFNVNDFRYNGKFHSYHADIIRLFEEVGFSMHDCVIIKWSNCMGACFASQIEERKMCAKQHEYLIVARKP